MSSKFELSVPISITRDKGHPQGGRGGAGLQPVPNPQKLKLKKKTDFVDIMISEVLRDLPFCRNQPLKSADDWYIRILKNTLIKLKKKQDDRTL
jgi:hypothetical protein